MPTFLRLIQSRYQHAIDNIQATPFSLQYWRERILEVIYFSVALLGGVAYLPSVYLSIKEEIWWLVVFNSLGYAWFLWAAFSTRVAFRVKAAGMLLFIYILAVALMIRLGPFAAGPLWLFVFPIMAGLLFGLRTALMCLLLNAATVIGFGFLMAIGFHAMDSMPDDTIAKWWVIGGNFILLDTVATLSLAVLLRGLTNSLDEQQRIQRSLKDKHNELQSANVQLTREITDRLRAEAKLKSSHEILLTVIDSIDADIFVADMKTHEVLLMNRHMQESYGGDRTGEKCWHIFQAEEGACPNCHVPKLVDKDGVPTGLYVWEDHNAASGRHYLNFDRAIRWTDGRLVQLQIGMDITDLTRIQKEKLNLEVQLRQAQKMEAIGTLAGGIAHDFNNILAAIIGFTEIAIDVDSERQEVTQYLQEVMTAAQRAKDLTTQILTFSRQAEVEPRPMQLGNVIRETVKLLRASLPTTIAIEERLFSDSPIVADPTQMHQVVLNLATNAAHAMENTGGRLTITLSDIDQRKAGSFVKGLEKYDNLVQLVVSDTGQGMSRSIVNRIFDPYFTTKIKGKGTGMGLAVVHGIVKSYGGEIRVESQLGRGSRFFVYLPAAEVRRPEADPLGRRDNAVGGSESILVVDDEPQIVDLLQVMLSSMGYRVSAHTDSLSAVRAFEADPHAFQLVLTDMTMPGITGEELARRVLRMRPDLPVLLATGFSESINEDQARRIGIRKLLFKPILREELAAVFREILEPTAGKRRPQKPDSRDAAHDTDRSDD